MLSLTVRQASTGRQVTASGADNPYCLTAKPGENLVLIACVRDSAWKPVAGADVQFFKILGSYVYGVPGTYRTGADGCAGTSIPMPGRVFFYAGARVEGGSGKVCIVPPPPAPVPVQPTGPPQPLWGRLPWP